MKKTCLIIIFVMAINICLANALTLREEKLFKALKLAVQYLDTSVDFHTTLAVYISPAETLRAEADRIEQKDRDVEYIRQVIQEIEEEINKTE